MPEKLPELIAALEAALYAGDLGAILKMSAEIERYIAIIYRQFYHLTGNSRVRESITLLIDDNETHALMLENEARALKSYIPIPLLQNGQEGTDSSYLEYLIKATEEAVKATDAVETLRLGVELETAIYKFYRYCAQLADDDGVKKTVLRIADDEKVHVSILQTHYRQVLDHP